MKIYFAGSIRGGRKDAELYRKVIAALKEKHQVLTEHVGDLSLSVVEDKGDKAIYEQDTAWLRECDVVVAECTQVSLGVGYELAYAEAHNKEVHIFYRPNETQLSAMLSGNEYFKIHRYNSEDELLELVKKLWGVNFMQTDKAEQYRELVEESQKSYRDNPDDHKNNKIELAALDTDNCKEINLYTYWQGLGYAKKTPYIKYLLVGQDWGNPFFGRKDFLKIIISINNGSNEPYYEKAVSDTDDNLVELFKVLKDSEGKSYDIATKRYDDLFFTNFCLGYRKGKESGGMPKGLMKTDAKFFKKLVVILEPDNILCLGKRTFECVYEALCGDKTQKPEGFGGAYNDFIEKYKPIDAEYGENKTTRIFPLAHPGYMGIMNRINRKGTVKEGLEKQKDDWKKIAKQRG
ncbi:nucleoside 2-deoxyribosyltransferase [Anaerovibrio lipolyticus]|uniref:nucleoside 2-deoxyribosyltransferase n=1 Tax=Anaerovibrio lipolyticus TaxID=82374 RepID=UPI0023F189F8|nr:nucleoside 2-deoxyribosyltransferase [Anaerovibrio lipolyticus]